MPVDEVLINELNNDSAYYNWRFIQRTNVLNFLSPMVSQCQFTENVYAQRFMIFFWP